MLGAENADCAVHNFSSHIPCKNEKRYCHPHSRCQHEDAEWKTQLPHSKVDDAANCCISYDSEVFLHDNTML